MKILQINNVYDFGSTGKIVRDLHHGLLKNGIDSVVYYGRRFKTNDPGVHKICSELYGKTQNGLYRITGNKYGGCFFSTNRLIKAIEKEHPDIVHLQCINGHFVNVYRLLEFLKKNNTPTVLTLHAEFMYTGGCGHAFDCEQWKTEEGCGQVRCPLYKKELKSQTGDRSSTMWQNMRSAFERFDNLTIVSVSPWLLERAKESTILKDKTHKVILNGLDTGIFHRYPERTVKTLKDELGYNIEDKIVFHATPSFNNDLSNPKGGHFVLNLAEKLTDVKFLIAGRYDPSIHVPDNVKLLGNLTDKARMAMLYSMADVTLLTSKRETFSMVCAESFCCGTPVAGFRAGAPERISIPEFSSFCNYGDLDSLAESVLFWLYNKNDNDIISNKAAELYKKERMIKEYIKVYQGLLNH